MRGTGEYANSGLNYTGTTVSELSNVGAIRGDILSSTNSKISLSVTKVNGDDALTFSSQTSSLYATIDLMDFSGNKIIFETDIYIDGNSDAWNSNGEIIGIYAVTGDNTSFWGFGDIRISSERIKDDAGTVIGHKYFIYTTNGGTFKHEIEGDTWNTLCLEREDISASGSNVNIYLNGEKIYTFTHSGTTTALSGIKIVAKDKSQNVKIHFDNTYFGSARECWGNRGSGSYANNNGAFSFSGVTNTTELKEGGALIGDVNFDSTTKPAVNVTEVDGNKALTLTSQSSSKYVGVAIMDKSNNKMVFQTDFYIDSASDSWGTNGVIAEIYSLINGSTNNFCLGSYAIYSERIKNDAGTTIGHNYFLHTDSVADSKVAITADEWHTLTIEREDISKTSNINVYLDGELVLTWSASKTTTALSHMKIATKDKTEKVTIHFDNVYFGSAKEE